MAWLAVIFASFGLFAPRNASVIAALLVAAIALAGPIFMMLEMDQPYGGLVKIPSTSLRVALGSTGAIVKFTNQCALSEKPCRGALALLPQELSLNTCQGRTAPSARDYGIMECINDAKAGVS